MYVNATHFVWSNAPLCVCALLFLYAILHCAFRWLLVLLWTAACTITYSYLSEGSIHVMRNGFTASRLPDSSFICKYITEGGRLHLRDVCPETLVRLMHDAWHADPAARPGMAEVSRRLQHHVSHLSTASHWTSTEFRTWAVDTLGSGVVALDGPITTLENADGMPPLDIYDWDLEQVREQRNMIQRAMKCSCMCAATHPHDADPWVFSLLCNMCNVGSLRNPTPPPLPPLPLI